MRISLALTAIVSLAITSIASAQAPAPATPAQPAGMTAPAPPPARRHPGNWMIEIHGSAFGDLLRSSLGGSGTGIDAFPPGTPFTALNGQPSRAVPSWAFGDGAVLFEEVRQSFAANHGLALPGITPLDPVMRSRGPVRTPATAVGGRFARNLTSWLAAEVSVDRGSRRSRLADEATATVEATRASYTAAFQQLLAAIPHTGGLVTAAATTTPESSDNQTIVTGSAVLSLVRTSRVGVHALFGGGVIVNDGSDFEVQLRSNYQFRLLSTFPINESETVTIRFAEKKQVPVGTVGLGFTLRVAGRSGLRVDARMLASRNTATTTVDASASRITAPQFVTFPSQTTPAIQFNSAPGTRTTLSGDPIGGLATYTGRGFDARPQVTVGYYVRF